MKSPNAIETLIEFCSIPAGSFMMGLEKINIDKEFCLGKYPVTQKQWSAIMEYNSSRFQGDSLPMDKVSWNDCQAFLKKLNTLAGQPIYRLPTDVEWEYACRAGSNSVYYFGDDSSQLGEYAWYDGNAEYTTHPVGQKKPNAWGLYDMLGNIWELTENHTPNESISSKRGGSWFNGPDFLRCSFRYTPTPVYWYDFYIGFRVVRSSIS